MASIHSIRYQYVTYFTCFSAFRHAVSLASTLAELFEVCRDLFDTRQCGELWGVHGLKSVILRAGVILNKSVSLQQTTETESESIHSLIVFIHF